MSEDKEKKSVVPKFASFKLKGLSIPSLESQKELKKPSEKRRGHSRHDSKSHKPSAAVPVFSSFKPKDLSESSGTGEKPSKSSSLKRDRDSSLDETATKRAKRDHDHHEPRREKRRHEKRHRSERSPSRDRHRDRHRERQHDRQRDRPPTIEPSSQPDQSSQRLFVIDTKGDPLISRYGSIDKSTVPRYQRHGHGRVLATSGRITVHYDGSREEIVLRFPGQEKPDWNRNLLPSKAFYVRPESKRIRSRADGAAGQGGANPDFIPFSSHRKRGREGNDHERESSGEEQPDYRSITGKTKSRELEEESDLESDLSESHDDGEQSLRNRSVLLSRRVKENPEDIGAWLALVDHQDTLMHSGEDPDREVLKDEAHSFSEVKIHMLESALRHAKSSRDRERILPRLMKEGSKVWSVGKSGKKWTEVLQEHKDSFILWRAFLDWSLGNAPSTHTTASTYDSTYDSTKQLFVRRLRLLSDKFDDRKMQDQTLLYSECIYVFLRATRFLHDAGYREVAVAAWQAQLEMSLLRPSGVGGDKDIVLSKFKDFWESEVPRLGEQRKTGGWRAYEDNPDFQDAPEPKTQVPVVEEKVQTLNVYEAWAHAERSAAQRCRMPARIEDDDAEEDPLRVVMFSDIEDLVFVLPPQLPGAIIEQLIDAYLIFCHAPPAFNRGSWTRGACDDQFLATTQLGRLAHETSKQPPTDYGADQPSNRKPDFARDGYRMAMSPWVLFPGADWFTYSPIIIAVDDGVVDGKEEPIDFCWTRDTIGELTQEVGVGELAPYCLSWYGTGGYGTDAGGVTSTLRKKARSLLGKYPDNIQLYSSFALAEVAAGHVERATNILSAGLEFCASDESALLLRQTWAWIHLKEGDKAGVIKQVYSHIDALDRSPSSVHILRARDVFASNRATRLREGKLDLAGCYGECLVLLEYVAATDDGSGGEPESEAQGNISAAMAKTREFSEEMSRLRHDTTSASHERLLQFAAQLLYLHTSRGPYRRVFVLEQVTYFLRQFPRNSIFQSLFFWSQHGLRTDDYRARALFYDTALLPAYDCPTSRAVAIVHELSRGNAHRAKAAFEHALASDACGSAPTLWRAYFRFCGGRDGRDGRDGRGSSKLKEVFYRAVARCPWHKDVMMEPLGMAGLLGDMSEPELKDIILGMEARGLRLYVERNFK